jgi:hypothetical protein
MILQRFLVASTLACEPVSLPRVQERIRIGAFLDAGVGPVDEGERVFGIQLSGLPAAPSWARLGSES